MTTIGSTKDGACTAANAPLPAAEGEIGPLPFLGVVASGAADVIDVRTGPEYRTAHVRGARHAPLHALDPNAVRAGRPAGATGPTYVLCQSGSRARMAAQSLRAAGVDCVVVTGGTAACLASGAPSEGAGSPGVWSIDRQVRFVAGLLVLIGVALGAFVHPYGYGLAAFVGAGLTFAGVTDFCGMALVLGRCPWNR